MRLLLTGSTGFVGQALLRCLTAREVDVAAAGRSKNIAAPSSGYFCVGELGAQTNWGLALKGVDIVVHLAALAHVSGGDTSEMLTLFRSVNVDGTLNLADQAAKAGVRRFVFVSSIGVNGNSNAEPFKPDDQPNPVEPYAQSKFEAEQKLWRVQQETGMEIVIIRPPLVYGVGAPGNFGTLVRWLASGVPLPLGSIHNKRSLVSIDNLVDLIIRCIDHPAAANQVFLAGDGEDLSTTELLRGVARAMGKPACLIPLPTGLLQLGARLLGRKAMAQRLLGSLQVDISKTCELLSWKPPYTVEEGLKRCFTAGKD